MLLTSKTCQSKFCRGKCYGEGGQLKTEVGEEGVGDERRGGGRWECRGWEVGERGEGGGREECGRKKIVSMFLNFTV